jgi:DNA-binding protein H-NS
MSNIEELIAQREAIDKQIKELQSTQRAETVAKVKALIAEFELTKADVFGATAAVTKKSTGKKGEVKPKYRDPVSGKVWSGRGIAPKWMGSEGKTKFLIP